MIQFILNFAPLSILLPLPLAIYKYRQFSPAFRHIAIYLFIVTGIQAVSYTLWYFGKNNLPLLHVYTALEFIFISLVYRHELKPLKQAKTIPLVMLLFTIFCIVNAIFLQSVFVYNTYARGTEAVLIIIYTLAYFYLLMQQKSVPRLENHPMFWINIAFLLYFSGALFLFALSNFMLYAFKQTNMLIWSIHAVWVLLMYVFIAIGLWKYKVK